MSFSDDMRLARVPAASDARCDRCGRPPHPTTQEQYRIMRTMDSLCLTCFFEVLGEDRRMIQESETYREQLLKRWFKSILFMGNGNQSLLQKRDLIERVEVAIEYLGGAQQAPMSTDTKECCDNHRSFCEEADTVVDATVRDVAMALTGKEWEPKEE